MFRGSIVALVTPMGPEGDVDFDALGALVEFHVEAGTDAIVSVGTTGESATLEPREHLDVIRQTVKLSAGRVPVIGGTGANSTAEALAMTREAMEAGVDACLLVVPYYNKPPQEGLYRHFKKIATDVPIPQILYNVPGRTSCDMVPVTVDRLADIPNIVGIKEASLSLERNRELVERCGDRLDVYSGDDPLACDTILAGGKGVISVTANAAPAVVHDMCAAALSGDGDTARSLDQRLAPLHKALFLEANPIPVKWAVAQLGLMRGGIRLPLTPLAEEYREEVRGALEHAGVV
jgi:4-hydroxy-tetrahydrodipicolinate synthase